MRLWIAIALLSSPAFAENHYLQVTVGNALYDVDLPGASHGHDSEHSQSLSLTAGKLLEKYAIEANYSHLGTFSISNTTDSITATIQTAGVSILPHYGPVFVKVGYEGWMMNLTINGTPENVSGSGPVYGLGASFRVGENSFIRLGYDVHKSIDDERVNVNPGVAVGYVGIVANF